MISFKIQLNSNLTKLQMEKFLFNIDDYEEGNLIGKGSYGNVYLAKNKKNWRIFSSQNDRYKFRFRRRQYAIYPS